MKLDLYGWFPEENKEILSSLIKEHNIKGVIEIGCFLGKSTAFFVSQGCRVFTIDTFEGSKDLNCSTEVKRRLPTLYEQFVFNMKELGIDKEVVWFKGTSEEASKRDIHADLIFKHLIHPSRHKGIHKDDSNNA